MKQKFNVYGMTCSACSAHVENAVKKLQGVQQVSVSLLSNGMVVWFDQSQVDSQQIVNAVKQSGYDATIANQQKSSIQTEQVKSSNKALTTLVASLAICAVLMYVAMGHMINLPLPAFLQGSQNALWFALAQLLLCLPVWYVNRNYFINGFKRLFLGAPNMDTLIAVGSLAGGLYGVVIIFVLSNALAKGDLATVEQYHHQLYFESSAMILALVDLGKYFEGHSRVKTGDALAKLRNLAPQKALLLVDGEQQQVDSKSIVANDIVVVKAGMVFPADGKVVFGNCFADESSISGESLPVEKQLDDFVTGGTVNVGGFVHVQVTGVGQDSLLEKIISLVEEAGASKAPIQRLADKISSVFVPVVMSISLVTLIVWLAVGQPLSVALNFAISVLVISCPCALGLATPVAIMVATGKGAENGILFKDGKVLEQIAYVKQVVLDKTGTITVGKPFVKRYQTTLPNDKFWSLIGGIERQSEHPLGKAIVNYATQMGVKFADVLQFTTVAGKGVVATVDNQTYAIGNVALMQQQGVDASTFSQQLADFQADACSCLLVSKEKDFVGIVGVGDQIKPTSSEAIELLKQQGVTPIVVTGDNATSANSVCRQVGIETFFADVLPSQKAQKVRQLSQQAVTAMVGDGINDAPALACSNVGFAVASGADIAIDSADVLLVKNDLRDISTAISLSRATKRNVKQNLFWAFFYNTLGILVASGVFYATPLKLQLSPMIGALAMSLSSLFVVTNALRLRSFRPPWQRKCSKNCALSTTNVENSVTRESVKKEDSMKYELSIEGMMCAHCSGRVENALRQIDGVQQVHVSLQEANAVVEVNDTVTEQMLTSAVSAQGYPVTKVKKL